MENKEVNNFDEKKAVRGKSRVCAGVLALLGFGSHNFYLGYIKKAVTQTVFYVLGIGLLCYVFQQKSWRAGVDIALGISIPLLTTVLIWSFTEAAFLLCGKMKADGKGKPLYPLYTEDLHKRKMTAAVVIGVISLILVIPMCAMVALITSDGGFGLNIGVFSGSVVLSVIGLALSVYATTKGGNQTLSLTGVVLNAFVVLFIILFCAGYHFA
ncbi:MAG: TM2 domain-containing protein [Firmicutes bacterium]|nr:TM2 domain-containing protein [Bacillota bacterium]